MNELYSKKRKEMKVCVLEINEWVRIRCILRTIPQLEKLLWFWTETDSNYDYENPTSDLNRDWVAFLA